MPVLKTFFALSLIVSMTLLTGCSKGGDQTSDAPPTDKSVVGDQNTSQYAEKAAHVQEGTTDPYTGTQDKENYAGKQPIADDQTAGEKMTNNKDDNQNNAPANQ